MLYGMQELYQQQGIAVIAGVAQTNPDRKRRDNAENKKKTGKSLFAGKLEAEQDKLDARQIEYFASGYTKAARPYRTEVKMKQYS